MMIDCRLVFGADTSAVMTQSVSSSNETVRVVPDSEAEVRRQQDEIFMLQCKVQGEYSGATGH